MADATKIEQIKQAKEEAAALRELANARASVADAAAANNAPAGVQANLAKMASDADKVAKAAEAAVAKLEQEAGVPVVPVVPVVPTDPANPAVPPAVDTSGLTTSIGFVLSRALLDDPTYGKGVGGLQEVYDLWAKGDETAALDAYFKSKWYTKLGKTAATRYATLLNQPEVYAADEAAYMSEQKNRLFKLGVRVDDVELDKWLKEAYKGNLTNSQLDSSIAMSTSFGAKFGGTILTQMEELKKVARSYGLSYTDAKYNQWGADLFANRITDAEIEKAIQTESASKYPAYANQIMNGTSVDALASAYKSAMSNILEIDSDSIGNDDMTLNKALQYVGPDGKPSTKPLWEFESDLRSDARWQFTNNARDSIDSLQYKVLKDWGFM